MRKIRNFLKQLVTAHTGISSKRVCGILGFLTVVGILIYCTVNVIQAPTMIEPFMYVICALLGIDSITGIWKKFDKENEVWK